MLRARLTLACGAALSWGVASAQPAVLPPAIAGIRELTLPGPGTDGKICVDFSPYVGPYFPGNEPPRAVVAALMDSMVATGRIKCLLTYGSQGGVSYVPELARARGLKVIQGAWLDVDPAANRVQTDGAIFLAKTFPDVVVAVMCGSEIRLRYNRAVAVPIITECVTRVRAGGVVQPVTHQATWPEWCDEEFPGQLFPACQPWTAISSIVDYISQTTYSWWESRVKIRFGCIPPEGAASFHLDRQLKVQSTYPDKLVVMSEVGYPGPPETYNDAPDGAPCQSANKQIQLTVMDQTLTACRDSGQGCILFSGANEPWKGNIEGTFGAYWGYCSAFPPYTCVFPPLGDAPLPPVPSPGPSLPPLPSVGTDALRALTTVTGQSFCADISPYVAGFGPGNEPSEAVVASVMDAIAASGRVKCIMTYGSQGASSFIPALAAARGIKVLQGAWLTEDPEANAVQYWGAKYLALAFPDTVVAVVCGFNLRQRMGVGIAEGAITDCISNLKGAGVKQPIGSVASWDSWCNEDVPGTLFPTCLPWRISSIADFIGVSAYAWWENQAQGARFPCIPAAGAADFALQRLDAVSAAYPGKFVMLAETGFILVVCDRWLDDAAAGWPGPPTESVEPGAPCAIASKSVQTGVFGELMGKCAAGGRSCMIFEANNEPWRAPFDGAFAAWWGYCSAEAPYTCAFPPVWEFAPAGAPLAGAGGAEPWGQLNTTSSGSHASAAAVVTGLAAAAGLAAGLVAL